jgi:hypothetical protein
MYTLRLLCSHTKALLHAQLDAIFAVVTASARPERRQSSLFTCDEAVQLMHQRAWRSCSFDLMTPQLPDSTSPNA